MMEHLKVICETDTLVSTSRNVVLIEAIKSLGRKYIRDKNVDFELTMEQRISIALHPCLKKLKKANANDREIIYNTLNEAIKEDSMQLQRPSPSENEKRTSNLFADFTDSDGDDMNTQHSQYCKELTEYLYMPSPDKSCFPNDIDDSTDLTKCGFGFDIISQIYTNCS